MSTVAELLGDLLDPQWTPAKGCEFLRIRSRGRAAPAAPGARAATERVYRGRDGYDKAKAAGKTKLTYGQWVDVRTPAFKEWFGDWEAARESPTFEVKYANGESRLVQRLAGTGLVEGGAGRLVRRESAEPSVYTTGRVRPVPYSDPATHREIDAEEARLIGRAKAEGFFWSAEKLPSILVALGGKRGGGNEHDVYIVGDAQNKVVIRRTVKDKRHGDTIREQFGFEPAGLTAEEARYLIGFRTADELRNRVAAARQARVDRLGAKGVRQGAEDDGGLTRLSTAGALPAPGARTAAAK